MEIKLYFRMLQRSWWLVILTVLSAVAAVLIFSYYTQPTYSAFARYVISPNPAYLSGGGVLDSLATLDKRSIITTYAEILNSPRIYQDTLVTLQLNDEILADYEYNAIVLPDTNIIEFSVQGPDPALTALLTNSIGQHSVEYIESLYQVYDMTVLDPAVIPSEPIAPQPLRDAGVALVVGLALGVSLALMRELLRAPIGHFMQQRKLDEVSTALNRNSFEDFLKDVAFASTKDFSLCMVHLDGLTDYVKVLPQPTLETVFRRVNQVMRDQLRGNDIVGRWDDVEFAVLLTETQGDAALHTMGRVRAALSLPIKIDISGEDLSLHPKIGIAEYRIGDTSESIVRNTNWALEIAKKESGIYLLRATEPI